jgi:hypothetical protein
MPDFNYFRSLHGQNPSRLAAAKTGFCSGVRDGGGWPRRHGRRANRVGGFLPSRCTDGSLHSFVTVSFDADFVLDCGIFAERLKWVDSCQTAMPWTMPS